MRALYFGSGRQYQQRQQQQYRSRTTTNARHEEIRVDYIPEDEVKKRKSSSGKKGGEYVDYEEVK